MGSQSTLVEIAVVGERKSYLSGSFHTNAIARERGTFEVTFNYDSLTVLG